MKFVLISIIIFYSHTFCFASAGSRSNAHEDYTESWMMTFGAGFSTRVISHDESSSDSSFGSVGEDSRSSDLRVSLGVGKEFFNQNSISFTLALMGGFSNGSFSSGEENQSQFEEKLSSVHIGGGLSVNYNLYTWGYKMQPYLGLDIIKESGKIQTLYDNGGNTTELTHEFEDMVALPGIGIRVFDDEVSLMSYFKVSMPQYLSDSFEASATVNGSTVAVTSATEFYRSPVAFELGFGYFF